MHKIVLWALGTVFLVASCSQYDDSSLVLFDFKRISNIRSVDYSNCVVPQEMTFSRVNNYVYDSLLISFLEASSHLVSVSDSRSDSLLGTFCPKGRSMDEPLNVIPSMDLFEEQGAVKSLFFSYASGNNRFFKWNVSESLIERKTLYDSVIQVESENGGILTAVSYYYLPGDKIIIHNCRQTINEWMEEPPTYEVYSALTGKREKIYSPFALYEGKQTIVENGLFSSKVYLTLEDCIKPTRDKLAFGMRFIPYLGVMDVNTGETRGVRLSGCPGLNTSRMFYYFMDLECNDEFIYALYCGSRSDSFKAPGSSEIFIFNWNCKLVGKLKVERAHKLCLDGQVLYLHNYESGKVYSIRLDLIKTSML